jgi:tellurite resistance protein
MPTIALPETAAVATARPAGSVRMTANLFGIPFGLAGLATSWSTARDFANLPGWPANVLWLVAAVVYLVTLTAYLRNVAHLSAEPADLTFGPFTSLIFTVPMMLGAELTNFAEMAGRIIFLIFLALVALYGGWLSGQWIIQEMPLAKWHPGYFLPTVAGPLVAAAESADLGYHRLALLMFGYGLTCWIILGSIILVRLFTQSMLPAALTPALAIELAPPTVGGIAWFEINGNRPDMAAYVLAGYAVLMGLVQLRLIPIYRKAPFGPGMWAFTFSYAAAVTVGLRWLAVEDVAGRQALVWVFLALITLGIAALATRTITALMRRTFLPRTA